MVKHRGRPRIFDECKALEHALALFWAHGYQATSLDLLVDAMNIRKSSFYSTFGSKKALFVRALQHYADESYALLQSNIATAESHREAREAVMVQLADVDGGRRGCFFANSLAEYGKHGSEVDSLLQEHMTRIELAFQEIMTGAASLVEARVMIAEILGLIAMRKAGVDPHILRQVMKHFLIKTS